MSTEKKSLPIDKNSHNKPSQESLPSSEQRPMGTEDDLEQNEKYMKEKEKNSTNSVGIREKEEGSGSSLG